MIWDRAQSVTKKQSVSAPWTVPLIFPGEPLQSAARTHIKVGKDSHQDRKRLHQLTTEGSSKLQRDVASFTW